ncbi:ROK family protein [Candidatus Woesearchaeota archaeon]|nr:ROK family protein [Candidatus Woesearchaeota archaeon]
MKYAIGIDLGATNLRYGLVDTDKGDIVWKPKKKKRTPFNDQSKLLSLLEESIKETRSAAKKKFKAGKIGAGMGSPGPLDQFERKLFNPFNIQCGDVDLSEHVDVLKNDLDMIGMGHFAYGAAHTEGEKKNLKDYDAVAVIAPGTGLGFTMIIDGKPYIGSRRNGGVSCELGWIPFFGSKKDDFKKDKFLEPYTAGEAPFSIWENHYSDESTKETKETLKEILSSGEKSRADISYELEQFAKQGDVGCMRTYEDIAKNLAIGTATFATLFNPDIVVFDGSISKAFNNLPTLKEYFKDTYDEHVVKPFKDLPVVFEPPVEDAGIKGAAYMAANSKELIK